MSEIWTITKVAGFSCRGCKTLYVDMDSASECCEPSFGEKGYTCPDPMCYRLHETYEEAEDCGKMCDSCYHSLKIHPPNAIDKCSMFGFDLKSEQYWDCGCTEQKWKLVKETKL